MRTLMLLRHAKSDWNAPTEGDFARPLNKRGRRAAAAMARQIAALDTVPQKIVSSPAVRAIRTAEAVAGELAEVAVEPEERLYGASVAEILDVARHLPKEISCALLIGHNPGMEECVHALGGDPDLLLKTCMLAVFRVDGGWGKLSAENCHLVRILQPSEEGDAAGDQ
jgi:phosphohistidine phosphatase